MKLKCTIRDASHVDPCDALAEASEGQKPTGKARGIYCWPFLSMETGQPTRTMFGAVTSEHKKGLIFNYCPWCGEELRESFMDAPEAETEKVIGA